MIDSVLMEKLYVDCRKVVAREMRGYAGGSALGVSGIGDADDVVQLVAIAAWKGFEQITWKARMLARTTMSRGRKYRGGELEGDTIEKVAPSPLDGILEVESASALREAVECLPDELKRIIEMRFYEGAQFRDIAEEVYGKRSAIAKVSARIQEALAMLKVDLGEFE